MMTRPKQGGRIRLDLREVRERSVEYAVTLHHEDMDATSVAELDFDSGELRWSEWATVTTTEQTPPPWLVEQSRAFLVTLLSKKKRDENFVWPRRVTRWRAPKA